MWLMTHPLFLLYLGNLDADVAYTREDFSFHIMSDGYVYGIALMHLIDVDREVILIVADTLSFTCAVFVNQLAVDRIYLAFARYLFVSVINRLFNDERKSHERIGTCNAKSQALFVMPGFE